MDSIMVTIARLVSSFPPLENIDHGLDPVFYYLSTEQAKLGLKIHIITPGDSKIPKIEINKSFTVHRVPFPYNINVLKKLFNLKSNENLDIIHSHATRGISTVFMKKKLATPIIGQIHGTTYSLKERSDEGNFLTRKDRIRTMAQVWTAIFRQKSMWSRLDRIFAVSKSISRSLIKYYSIDPNKIRVLYNAVDPNRFMPQNRNTIRKLRNQLLLGDDPIILFVGSFRPIKGIHILLTAMKRILSKNPNVKLILIGGLPQFMQSQSSYYMYLRQCTINLRISDSVRFLNKVPHSKLPTFYSMADLVIMPSLYESFGKVAVEAMACETPVIASKVGGLPEIIDNGIDGVLINVGSAEMLSMIVNKLLDNYNEAKKMGQRGRVKVLTKFTWEKIAERSLEYYNDLLVC